MLDLSEEKPRLGDGIESFTFGDERYSG